MNLKDWRAMSPEAQRTFWKNSTLEQRRELDDQGLSFSERPQDPYQATVTRVLKSIGKYQSTQEVIDSLRKASPSRPEDKRDLEPLLMDIRRPARILKLDPEQDIHGMLENNDLVGLRNLRKDLWGRVYARTKKSNCVVEKLHDDGDASIRCGDKKFVVTTEGEIYEKVPPKPVARINKSGDVEMVKNEMAEQLYLDIFGEEKKK